MGCGGSTAQNPTDTPAAAPADKPAAPAPAPKAAEKPKPAAAAPEPAAPAEEPVAEEKKEEVTPAAPAADAPAPAEAEGAKGPKPKVVVMGPPSSGKGQLISKLANVFGLVQIKEAWLVKKAKEASLPSAAKAEGVEGPLPDELTVEVLKEVCEHHKEQGFILDGLPKNAKQAELLKEAPIDKVIVADISEADLLEYFGNRVQDPNEPGKFYDLKNDPPPEGEVAERCTKRDEDAEDKVKERIAPYFAELDGITAAFGDKVLKVPGTTKSGDAAKEAQEAMFESVKKELPASE